MEYGMLNEKKKKQMNSILVEFQTYDCNNNLIRTVITAGENTVWV